MGVEAGQRQGEQGVSEMTRRQRLDRGTGCPGGLRFIVVVILCVPIGRIETNLPGEKRFSQVCAGARLPFMGRILAGLSALMVA